MALDINSLDGLLDYSDGKGLTHHSDITEIKYFMNSDEYRSDNFSAEVSDKLILSSGCSVTFGTGLPVEKTWPTILRDSLGLDHYANVSVSGMSSGIIIDNVFTYIRKYGKPMAVTVLLPNLKRYYSITAKNNKNHFESMLFHHISPHKKDGVLKDQKDLDFMNSVMTTDNLVYELVSRLLQLEEYLSAIDVPLVYTIWDDEVSQILKDQNILQNLFLIDKAEKEEYLFENRHGYANEYEKLLWDQAADRPSPHPGISEHKFYAKKFYEELKKRYSLAN